MLCLWFTLSPLNLLSFSGVELALAYLGLASNTIPLWVRKRRQDDPTLSHFPFTPINEFLILEHSELSQVGKMKTDFKVRDIDDFSV